MKKNCIDKQLLLLFGLLVSLFCGCNSKKAKNNHDTDIKSSIDSLQNIEKEYSAKVVYYSDELQNFRRQYPQYDNIELLSNDLYDLYLQICKKSDSVEYGIQNLAKPFYSNPSIIKWFLRRYGFYLKEQTLTTQECIDLLNTNKNQIKDIKAYKTLLCDYAAIQEADSIVNNLIFDADPYAYQILEDIFNDEDKKIYTDNLLQNASIGIQKIQDKNLSSGINKQVSKTQRCINILSRDNAIEDSLLMYQNKQQEIQVQIQHKQQLLNQKNK